MRLTSYPGLFVCNISAERHVERLLIACADWRKWIGKKLCPSFLSLAIIWCVQQTIQWSLGLCAIRPAVWLTFICSYEQQTARLWIMKNRRMNRTAAPQKQESLQPNRFTNSPSECISVPKSKSDTQHNYFWTTMISLIHSSSEGSGWIRNLSLETLGLSQEHITKSQMSNEQ